MVEILQVLEGATYMAFIAGAIFAVIELRDIKRDRKTQMLLQTTVSWCSKDFEEAMTKVRELKTDDPKEIEEKCGKLSLFMVIDYLDGIGGLGETKAIEKRSVLDFANWYGLWESLEPWILYWRKETNNEMFAGSFEWAVQEDSKLVAKYVGKNEFVE